MFTYIAARHHLSCNIFEALLKLRFGSVPLERVDGLQVGFKKLEISTICQADIFALANNVPIPVRAGKGVQQSASKVRGIGDIGHFVEGVGQIDGNKVAQAREADIVEALFHCKSTKSLTVVPDIFVGHAEQVLQVLAGMNEHLLCERGQTIVYKTIRDDGKFGTGRVDALDRRAEAVHVRKRQFLCSIWEFAHNLALRVGGLERECWEAHGDCPTGLDMVIDNRQKLECAFVGLFWSCGRFVKAIAVDNVQDLGCCL